MKTYLLPLVLAAVCVAGCRTYDYRVVQPPGVPGVIADQPVIVHYDPLDYRLSRQRNRLNVRINNPSEDRIILTGNKSFVVDPQGESHPIRGRPIGPHSYVWLSLPPVPITYAYPDYGWGPGWGVGMGWGWYDPFWGPFYGGYWGPPPVSYYQIVTPYDWTWKTGPVRLRLTYDRNGKTFEHDFEIVREPRK